MDVRIEFELDLILRSVGRTQMNEQSSRSHFVFTMRISGVNEAGFLIIRMHTLL